MKEVEWHVSPENFSLIWRKRMDLCKMGLDGEEDTSEFETYMMQTFGLRPYVTYRIVVDWTPRITRIFDNWPDGHTVKAERPR